MSSSQESTESHPLKIFIIYDSLAEEGQHPELFKEKFTVMDPETNLKFKEELAVLLDRFGKLKLKVDERVPVESRVHAHKWFVTKDRYGFVYFALFNFEWFGEKTLFSMINKLKKKIHQNKDMVQRYKGTQERKLISLCEGLANIVGTYNDALANGENPNEAFGDSSIIYSVGSIEDDKSLGKRTGEEDSFNDSKLFPNIGISLLILRDWVDSIISCDIYIGVRIREMGLVIKANGPGWQMLISSIIYLIFVARKSDQSQILTLSSFLRKFSLDVFIFGEILTISESKIRN